MLSDARRGASDTPPSALIERIYDASVNDAAWRLVMPEITEFCRARCAVIVVRDRESGRLSFAHESGMGTEYRNTYLGKFRGKDLRLDDLLRQPVGTIRTDTMIPHYTDYKNSGAYRELYSTLGTEHALGAFLHTDQHRQIGLRVFRSRRDGPFTDREIACYEALLPHLSRSMRLRALQTMDRAPRPPAEQALDHLSFGVFAIHDERQVLPLNRAAETMRDLNRDALTQFFARFASRATPLWRRAGESAFVAEFPDGLVGCSDLDGAHAFLKFPLLAEHAADGPSDAIAFVSAPRDAVDAGTDTLRGVFGLTDREHIILREVVSGVPPLDVSKRHDIAYETVRTHLKSVLSKTGSKRQLEAVRKALSTPHLTPSDEGSPIRLVVP